MKIKSQNKQAGIFIVPVVWWAVIGGALAVHIILLGVFLIISILLNKEPIPAPIPPPNIEDVAEELNAPMCNCGGTCPFVD